MTQISSRVLSLETVFVSFLALKKKTVLVICIALAISFPIVYNMVQDYNKHYYSNIISNVIQRLAINETLHFNRFYNTGVSFEGYENCNIGNETRCFMANKSLVIAFWRHDSRDKWLAKNFLKIFDDEHFTRVIMIHDNSSWSSYPDQEHFIWIHVHGQRRFWYLKRFITPVILKTYNYIWVLDDDVELLFDPLHYECVATKLNISLSAPGRAKGVASHEIARVNKDFTGTIGRWTDFVEIGPIFVAQSIAWQCLWNFLSSLVGMGWGLDLIWCQLLTHKCHLPSATSNYSCAVLDVFHVNHLSEYIGSTALGSREVPVYNEFYGEFSSKQINFAPLAKDNTIYSACKRAR